MWIQRMRVNALDHYEKLDWLDFMARKWKAEDRKKGGRYKTAESRGRMLARLKELTGNDFELAKKAICHCVDSGYQGFCNGNELFYKPANDPPKPPETSAEDERKRQEIINRLFED